MYTLNIDERSLNTKYLPEFLSLSITVMCGFRVDSRRFRVVVKRKTEVGRTFTVTASQVWNKLPLSMRKLGTLKAFKNTLLNGVFKSQ